jgi:hypothetical protein
MAPVHMGFESEFSSSPSASQALFLISECLSTSVLILCLRLLCLRCHFCFEVHLSGENLGSSHSNRRKSYSTFQDGEPWLLLGGVGMSPVRLPREYVWMCTKPSAHGSTYWAKSVVLQEICGLWRDGEHGLVGDAGLPAGCISWRYIATPAE